MNLTMSVKPVAVFLATSLILGSAFESWAQANPELTVEPTGVGIGIATPERLLHLKGDNAVLRMDRSSDTAAFLMVRTTPSGSPMKTFALGTNASAAGTGEFIVSDLGAAVGGPGMRRMTITNTGEVHFTGTLRAPTIIQTSSERFKHDIKTIDDASSFLEGLRGVRFVWKHDGSPSAGVIAEDVAKVLPELVELNENHEPTGVNYAGLTAVLIEALKEQQLTIERQALALQTLQFEHLAHEERVGQTLAALTSRINYLNDSVNARNAHLNDSLATLHTDTRENTSNHIAY